MWLFALLWSSAAAHGCCSTCHCQCQAPAISANMTLEGLHIDCPDATCACVTDELDGCTFGGTWEDHTLVQWHDARWHRCIQVTHADPLQATATLRWWDNAQKCMGHTILHIETQLDNVQRDVNVDFEVTQQHQHGHILPHVFYVYARSGCDDPRPIVDQSTMFFEVEMDPPQTGVHVEITSCTVQTTAGVHGEVLTNTSLSTDGSGPHGGLLNPQKNRLTYTAFWDDVSNSPFHHIMCMYAIFNGTHASPHASGRAYMVADPNEHGILQYHS